MAGGTCVCLCSASGPGVACLCRSCSRGPNARCRGRRCSSEQGWPRAGRRVCGLILILEGEAHLAAPEPGPAEVGVVLRPPDWGWELSEQFPSVSSRQRSTRKGDCSPKQVFSPVPLLWPSSRGPTTCSRPLGLPCPLWPTSGQRQRGPGQGTVALVCTGRVLFAGVPGSSGVGAPLPASHVGGLARERSGGSRGPWRVKSGRGFPGGDVWGSWLRERCWDGGCCVLRCANVSARRRSAGLLRAAPLDAGSDTAGCGLPCSDGFCLLFSRKGLGGCGLEREDR